MGVKNEGEERRLMNFEKMLDKFLEESDFERVEGLGNILKV